MTMEVCVWAGMLWQRPSPLPTSVLLDRAVLCSRRIVLSGIAVGEDRCKYSVQLTTIVYYCVHRLWIYRLIIR